MNGFVEDPNNPGDDCLRKFYMYNALITPTIQYCFLVATVRISLQFATYRASEGDISIQVCAEVANGTIEMGETFLAVIRTSPFTASRGRISY